MCVLKVDGWKAYKRPQKEGVDKAMVENLHSTDRFRFSSVVWGEDPGKKME